MIVDGMFPYFSIDGWESSPLEIEGGLLENAPQLNGCFHGKKHRGKSWELSGKTRMELSIFHHLKNGRRGSFSAGIGTRKKTKKSSAEYDLVPHDCHIATLVAIKYAIALPARMAHEPSSPEAEIPVAKAEVVLPAVLFSGNHLSPGDNSQALRS